MKAVLTFIAVFSFGTIAMAQTTEVDKVETIIKPVELHIEFKNQSKSHKEVARLYRYKNSRVKKELAFRTKRNRAKLA